MSEEQAKPTEEVLDEWVLARNAKKKELIACQESRGLQSCSPCEAFLECPLRDAYVKAVYDSMNKGTGGGFEF